MENLKTKKTTVEISEEHLALIDKYKGDSFKEKLYEALSRLKWIYDRYPNLLLDPQNPDTWNYPPCQFIYPKSYEGKFYGFHCLNPRPPLNLPKTRIGKLMITLVEPPLCLKCCEISLKQKIIQEGKILPNVPLQIVEQIKLGMTMLKIKNRQDKIKEERIQRLQVYHQVPDEIKRRFPFFCPSADKTFNSFKDLPCSWFGSSCANKECHFFGLTKKIGEERDAV